LIRRGCLQAYGHLSRCDLAGSVSRPAARLQFSTKCAGLEKVAA
jgi:hypothetical protein